MTENLKKVLHNINNHGYNVITIKYSISEISMKWEGIPISAGWKG